MNIIIRKNRRRIKVDVNKTGFIRMGLGLMFRSHNTRNLLFDFQSEVYYRGAITSWFVFFPFLAVWLDKNNKAMESRIVQPFKTSILPKKPFYRLVELPINAKNRHFIDFLVGK